MISVSRLLCGGTSFGDSIRYEGHGASRQGVSAGRGPVVVWNCTRTCNLQCLHCYSASDAQRYPNELDTNEAKVFIDSLAAFNVPVLLISGGEPLVRPDIIDLAEYAAQKGLRTTFSTNGTLLTSQTVARMKAIGVGYVGISFDGLGATHDFFRGREGAFQGSLKAVRLCLSAGQKVGVRFTINRHNHTEIDGLFDLVVNEGIPRVCFYHLVYTGRGAEMMRDDLQPEQKRHAIDTIMRRTQELYASGLNVEVLTVDNHADGPYMYLQLAQSDPERAKAALELLQRNGGNRSGVAIACVDNQGNVHPDQFTAGHVLGNVRERSFGEIWRGTSDPLLQQLRERSPLLKGRCGRCSWLPICNGNFRVRAEAVFGDYWAEDPACYLTEEELAQAPFEEKPVSS